MKIRGDTVYLPMQRRPNAKRLFALVDLEDYERVSQHRWFAQRSGRTWYANCTTDKILPTHHMRLHAFIMRAHKGQTYDHINGDGLDNRKANLRLATQAENARNSLKTDSAHVTSRFKGVSRSSSGRWIAQIRCDGDCEVLGLFDTEADAAQAYDIAAVRLFGDFAKTNAMMGLYESEAPIRPLSTTGVDGEGTSRARVAQSVGALVQAPWQDFLNGLERDVDYSINHRDRRRSSAAKAKRAVHTAP